MNNKLKLFLTAFMQVMLIAMNVIFISHKMLLPMLLTGFGISWFWSTNVKQISVGGRLESFVYALGASTGTGIGYYLSTYLMTIL